MKTGDTSDFRTDDGNEAVDEPQGITLAPVDASATQQIWARRAVLKAAALGTAVLVGRAGSTLAHIDTKSACKAQDIEVTGGTIINEPCECTGGEFEAIAEFEVTNNNNATRKCIAIHLGTGSNILEGKDFYLFTGKDGKSGSQNISGNGTTQTMYAALGSLPCNFGTECFAGSVIAFQTAQNQSDDACPAKPEEKYPGGQCRRQKICIVGFNATLECANSDCSNTSNDKCKVDCGGNLYLKATASGFSDSSCEGQDYTFTVTDPAGNKVAEKTGNSPQCLTVTPTTSGTYTLTVTDCKGCTRTASKEVTVSDITVSLSGSDSTGCDGKVKFTASSSGSNCTFEFSVDGTVVQAASSTDTYTYDPFAGGLDLDPHTVTVDADCGGCKKSASKSVQACVKTTVSAALANRTTSTATESNRKRKRRD